MTEIFLSVDLGQSLTKVVYRIDSSGKTYFVLINSSIAFTTTTKLEKYREHQGWIGKPRPEMQAWLKLDGNSQTCILGELSEKFTTEEQIEESKSSYAGYKVLGAIGAIAQNHNLDTSKKISINVGILLPVNEYQDRQRLKNYLQEIRSFLFRDEKIKLDWQNFMILPEGGGLVSARVQQSDKYSEKYGVLVMGHRNLTALYFEKGQMIESASPLLGFHYVLKRICKYTSVLNEDRLLKAICEASLAATKDNSLLKERKNNSFSYPDWSKFEAINRLSKARDKKLRQQETEDLAGAIDSALEIGTEEIEVKLLNRIFPPKMDEIIISGGSSFVFQPFLEKYFNCTVSKNNVDSRNLYEARSYRQPFTPIAWEAGETKKICNVLNLTSSWEDGVLIRRLADSFCLMMHMVTIYK